MTERIDIPFHHPGAEAEASPKAVEITSEASWEEISQRKDVLDKAIAAQQALVGAACRKINQLLVARNVVAAHENLKKLREVGSRFNAETVLVLSSRAEATLESADGEMTEATSALNLATEAKVAAYREWTEAAAQENG